MIVAAIALCQIYIKLIIKTQNTDKWIGYQRTEGFEFAFGVKEKGDEKYFHRVSFQIDTDGSGSIDFEGFVKIMN